MTIQDFRRIANNEVGEQASVGQGKLAVLPNLGIDSLLFHSTCRDAHRTTAGEQDVLRYIFAMAKQCSYPLSHMLIVNYYVSLKTNPFVILTGAEGRGKTELARLFAEALVGANNNQYTLIPSMGVWPGGTGEDQYYRELHTQFSAGRFLDILQEASDTCNAAKAYLVCFDALHPNELTYYFARLLHVTPTGIKRLNLPGFPPADQPIVPPNVYITATVNTVEHKGTISSDVLRRAGLIEIRAPDTLVERMHTTSLPTGVELPKPLPPVGYQRLWMRAAQQDLTAASLRLAAILGEDRLSRLQCSPQLAQLLWRGGLVLTSHTLKELTAYIANSFDECGRGLFDPNDVHNNAQIAFDAQVVQRVLWRLRTSADDELRQDLAAYLDSVALITTQQAVA